MEPISNQQFSHDFKKFVWQEPNAWVINYHVIPKKPFSIDPPKKSEESKKDLDKEKDQKNKKQ